jgi:hypothetical protein
MHPHALDEPSIRILLSEVASMKPDPSILELLDAVPQERLSSEQKKRLVRLHHSLNELGRIDEATGETFVDEKSLRKLLKEHAPAGFEERCVTFLRTSPDGHLLVADWGSRKTVKAVDWQTAFGKTVASKSQSATLESLGLSPRSTRQEVKRALQQRMPDLSDDLFDSDAGAALDAAVNGLAGMQGNPDDYWRRFQACMGALFVFWVGAAVLAFVFALRYSQDILASLILVGGASVIFWAVSIVWCLSVST